MTTYAALRSRAGSLVAALPPGEATDARSVLAACDRLREAFDGGAEPGLPEDENVRLRIELRGLAERLGRRSAEGIPFASLARALSADLHRSRSDARLIRDECDAQLLTFGL